MGKQLVLCLIICATLTQGSALKCYSCDSLRNPSCNDLENLEKVPLTECSVLPGTASITTAVCMKMSTEDNHTGIGNVTRKCITTPKNTDACRTASSILDLTHIKLIHCSTCETDQCNSALNYGASTYTIVALVAGVIAFFLKM